MKKRIFAMVIDMLLLGVAMFFAVKYLPLWIWMVQIGTKPFTFSFPSIGGFVVVLYIAGKDLIFRNASIGKKILGLKVVSNEGKAPKLIIMLLHSFVISTVGWLFLWIKKAQVSEWELKYLKATVKEAKPQTEAEKKQN